MNSRLFIPALIFLLLQCSTAVMSQSESSDTSGLEESTQMDEKKIDTVVLPQNIPLSGNSIQEYKKGKEFSYIYNLDSLLRHSGKIKIDTINPDNLARFKPVNKSASTTQSIAQPPANIFNNGVIKILLWTLALGFILFILYKLFLGEALFKKDPVKNELVRYEQEKISLESSGYDLLINEAVQNKNYRLATRFLYLQALKNLSQTGLIEFSPDKTNNQYVRELLNKPYQKEFASLTLQYEYIWYGKFGLSEDLFGSLRKDFTQFQQKIKR